MSDLSSSIPKDTVILHAIEPGKTVPNPSPFILKLETFMRMAKIPYMIDTSKPIGPAGKTPWITFHRQTISDSQIIIEYLTRYFDRDVWGVATEEQKAVARSLRIVMEEHLYWGMLRWRVVESIDTLPELVPLSPLKFKLLKAVAPRLIRKRLQVQGLGRHDWETCVSLTITDIQDFSTLLADKPFFLGEEPCEADCAFFGMLANILWASSGSPYEKAVSEGEPRLSLIYSQICLPVSVLLRRTKSQSDSLSLKDERLTAYCERMKAKFWPDWDERLAKK